MNRFLFDNSLNPDTLSPLTLAFIGDSIFDLLVREKLVCHANRPANDFHNLAVKSVKASSQAGFMRILSPFLTEKEKEVYKRGRNAKVGHLPKNASVADYHNATGFEALFGYLYLNGNVDRMLELFEKLSIEV